MTHKPNSDKHPTYQDNIAFPFSDPEFLLFESTGPGGRLHPDLMGLYRLTDQLVQDSPVYKHVATEAHVFVGPNGYWRVGPDTATGRRSWLKYLKNSPTPTKPL